MCYGTKKKIEPFHIHFLNRPKSNANKFLKYTTWKGCTDFNLFSVINVNKFRNVGNKAAIRNKLFSNQNSWQIIVLICIEDEALSWLYGM